MVEPNTLSEKIRLGEDSTRRQLRSEQLARLFQQRSQTGLIRFDEELIPMATLADLAEPLWQRFRPARIQEPAEATLRELGLARQDEEGGWRPTVSGILMASSDPRRHLPNAFIQAVAYRGKTVAPEGGGYLYQLDAKDITGPLDAQVTEACRFVASTRASNPSTRGRWRPFSARSSRTWRLSPARKGKEMADVTKIREAIIEALPVETANHGEAPDAAALYIPPSHIKALRLECNLVVGARGVGKSFWTAALDSSALRATLGSSVRELDHTDVRIGFSVTESIDRYPNAETFAQTLGSGIEAYDIWRAVVVRWLAETLSEELPGGRWAETVAWMKENPEDISRLMQRANSAFIEKQRFGLIVFDALDRTSNDWRVMDGIVRDVLRVALWLKSYRRLHAKVFLREDQFERTVTDFPDASKLLATKAELTWARHDLHGLLWQRLINAPDEQGERLRALYRSVVNALPVESKGVWPLPDEIKKETPTQRALFETLSGPWMGRDRRRGVPYVWAVGHLADGKGRTSPRSFLAAIRQAAEDSLERYPDHPLPLHYESIKRGIQKASEIRVDEMAEDYPWVRTFMSPLSGLTVPCDYSAIFDRWRQNFPNGPGAAPIERLPPQHAERGWDGIKEDLIRLGVFDVKKDGRIDMPDLYRVGFGLGRRGGVKPRS